MEKLILVKLGGSVITDKSKTLTAKLRVIRRLGREIVWAQRTFKGKLIIGHGSGSFGHTFSSKYKTHKGLRGKDRLIGVSLTADAAAQLNRIVTENLLKVGLDAISFAPSSFIVAKGNKPHRIFLDPVRGFLRINMTPVVFGDVIYDSVQGFTIFSTEKVLGTLLGRLKNDYKIMKVIHCAQTDGVYDQDGKTLKRITLKNFSKIRKQIGGSDEIDVTGGMIHKVEESLRIASKHRIESLIINGNSRGSLKNAIVGYKAEGTRISYS